MEHANIHKTTLQTTSEKPAPRNFHSISQIEEQLLQKLIYV